MAGLKFKKVIRASIKDEDDTFVPFKKGKKKKIIGTNIKYPKPN